jgi:hypothetical protein
MGEMHIFWPENLKGRRHLELQNLYERKMDHIEVLCEGPGGIQQAQDNQCQASRNRAINCRVS